MLRIIFGGVAGGVVMFIWGALSHMALGLEESAIKDIPNEAQVLPVLQTNINQTGFYFFPGMNVPSGASKEQKAEAEKKWTEKYQAGPRGILVYHPEGEQAMSPKQLGLQLAAEIAAGLVAAIVLASAINLRSYGGRVLLVTLLGLLPVLMVNFPYWNWYGFPDKYTLVQLADKLASFFLGGIILAAIVKPTSPAAVPQEKLQLG
jgi:hypothetical protein